MRLISRRRLSLSVIVGLFALLLVSVLFNFKKEPYQLSQEGIYTLDTINAVSGASIGEYTPEEQIDITIYETLNEGVVNITTTVMAYNFFLEAIPQEGASGSGSIIDKEGYVLTNNHVVEDAEQVYITLADGTQFEGEVIGMDRENDLSIVKFDPKGKDLTVIPFGSSTNLKVGQKVLAIGNPYGLERTMSTGIVSAPGRPIKNESNLIIRDMIQTDAAINPGNSGGPLLNTRGEMIGITTMIFSPSGGSVGIGFSVPVDTAKRVVPDLIDHGYVQRGWIDIEPIQLFPNLVRYAQLPVSQGILVSRVTPNSPADRAGLQGGSSRKAIRLNSTTIIYLGGDIIVGINGRKISDYSDFYSALEESKPGDTVSLNVIRNNKSRELDVELTVRPEGSY